MLSENSELLDSINYDYALGTILFTALHKSTFNNPQNNDMGLLTNNALRKKNARFYDFYSEIIRLSSNELDAFKTYQNKLPTYSKNP